MYATNSLRAVVDSVLVLTPPVQDIRVDRGERVADLVDGRGFGVPGVVFLFDAPLNVGVGKVVSDIFAAVSDDFLLVVFVIGVFCEVLGEREHRRPDLVTANVVADDLQRERVAVNLGRRVDAATVRDDDERIERDVVNEFAVVEVEPVVLALRPAVLVSVPVFLVAVGRNVLVRSVGLDECVGHCLSPSCIYATHPLKSCCVYATIAFEERILVVSPARTLVTHADLRPVSWI